MHSLKTVDKTTTECAAMPALVIAGSPDIVADSFFKGAVLGFPGYR